MSGAVCALMAAAVPAAGGGGPVIGDLFGIATYTGDGSVPRAIQPNHGPVNMASGGSVWDKSRSTTQACGIVYTPDGSSPQLTDSGGAISTAAGMTFTSTGVTLTDNTFNVLGRTYVLWFHKKAARYHDVVAYSGNGANRTIAHALATGVAAGIIKRTDTLSNFFGYHDSLGAGSRVPVFSSAAASSVDATAWNGTAPTSSVFSLGASSNTNNAAGQYVAFLFAHDTASDGVIRGVGWTGNGSASGPSVACGWQPQALLVIPDSGSQRSILDQTRTPGFTSNDAIAFVSATTAENSSVDHVALIANGFSLASTNALTNGSAVPYYGLVMRA